MGRNNVNAVRRKERRPNWYEEVRLPSCVCEWGVMNRVWEIDKIGTCARYGDYMNFYSGLIDEDATRRKRKCPNCPDFDKKNNVLVVDGDCRFHLLRQLSSLVSFSSVLVVPDLLLQKYEGFDALTDALDLVDVYYPSMEGDDIRSIHVFKRVYEKKWVLDLPLLLPCLTSEWS